MPKRSSRQPSRRDASQQDRRTWDVDPAEIDRFLSGRPSRAQESGTAGQLSRLQHARGRRSDAPAVNSPRSTYRGQAARDPRTPYQPEPDPVDYAEDEGYDDYLDEPYEAPAGSYGYDDVYADDEPWEQPAPAPQPRRQASRQRPATRERTQAPRYEPEMLDDDEDVEFYNDDPYLSYEDTEIDRRPPRARAARQRTAPKISRPNLPNITIPKSVTDSPLLADMPSLVMMGISILSLAVMAFLVSDRISLLGDTIPTHVSASGDPENIKTSEAVWNIPLLAGMVMLMNIAAAWFISRIDQFASRFLLSAGLLVHFIAWVAVIKYLWE